MIRPGIPALLPLVLLAIAACSDRSGTDGTEGDFASRVGNASSPSAAAPAAPVATTAAAGPPSAGANVFAMEKLGDIGGVDLGARAGGCTFSSNGTEMLIAAAPVDRTLPGKGVVRIGGKLIRLDTPPGGGATIKSGTTYAGEGFSIRIQPTAPGKATLTVSDSAGKTKAIAGDYICA